MGDGQLRTQLEDEAASLAPGRVTWLGFRNQSEAPSVYAAADVLVLPSDKEPWGLVVNEGMNAGLPTIVSDRVGSSADLVTDDTGFIFPAGDLDALVSAMAKVAADADLRRRLSNGAKELISQWDFSKCAEGIAQAMHFVSSR